MSSPDATHYRSFILRVWNDETDAEQQPRRRYILLEPECEYRRGFTSLDQLFATLAMVIGSDAASVQTQVDIIQEVEAFLHIQ